jgi:cellulose synthase/poly-beta-1,6-N-acetylglucosamine synthase-like glycosyltransferase
VDVTITVCTYGAEPWAKLAQERAVPSARAQGVQVLHHHGTSLSGARNAALEDVRTEWVLVLDADDELRPGYVEALAAGTADVRAPAVQYVTPGGRPAKPYVPKVAGHRHACSAECLEAGNWIVVGAMVRAEMVRSVGGWESFTWSEDWALWARCWKAGATFEAIPEAVYVAHVRRDSRNRAASRAEKNAAHWQIHRAVWPELYKEAA